MPKCLVFWESLPMPPAIERTLSNGKGGVRGALPPGTTKWSMYVPFVVAGGNHTPNFRYFCQQVALAGTSGN